MFFLAAACKSRGSVVAIVCADSGASASASANKLSNDSVRDVSTQHTRKGRDKNVFMMRPFRAAAQPVCILIQSTVPPFLYQGMALPTQIILNDNDKAAVTLSTRILRPERTELFVLAELQKNRCSPFARLSAANFDRAGP